MTDDWFFFPSWFLKFRAIVFLIRFCWCCLSPFSNIKKKLVTFNKPITLNEEMIMEYDSRLIRRSQASKKAYGKGIATWRKICKRSEGGKRHSEFLLLLATLKIKGV